MIRLPLTDLVRRHALRMAREVVSCPWIRDKRNQTGNAGVRRYEVGYLGELSFAAYLRDHGVRFTYDAATDKVSDSPDFVARRFGREFALDCKTGEGRWTSRMMTPQEVFIKTPRDAYVGMKLVEDAVELWGWASLERMKKDGQVKTFKCPTRFLMLEDLDPIESLVASLESGAYHVVHAAAA